MNKKIILFFSLFFIIVIGLGVFLYFSSDAVLTSEEKKIMKEIVRYDMADSLLTDPSELDITFSSISFEKVYKDIFIVEFLVDGSYKEKPFTWRVWKNTKKHPIWSFSSRECTSGCPESVVFTTKEDMKTFMELNWLKREHNRLVDECLCSNVAVKKPSLPIIEVTDETTEYIEWIHKNYLSSINVEEERRTVEDSVELIEENSEFYRSELTEDAYGYFLKDISRYIQYEMMRYDEVINTYGITSDEMIALATEANGYDYDDFGGYASILYSIDAYHNPSSYDGDRKAFKELLVPFYRLYEFTKLHALYHEETDYFLSDIEREKRAIKNAFSEYNSTFKKYNLNKSLFTFENPSKKEYTVEDNKESDQETNKNKESREETAKKPVEKPKEACGKSEPLFIRSLGSHDVTVNSDDAVFSTLDFSYAGGEAGDTIAEGTFYLCVDSSYKLPLSISSINLQRDNLIYSINAESSLLVIEEYGTSNGNFAYLYTLINGKVIRVAFNDGQGIFTGTPLKESGSNKYQYMYYDNSTFTYFLYEIEISESGNAEIIQYAETDQTLFERFVQDPNYIYTP